MEICATQKPPWEPINGGGAAACHLHAHGPRLGGRSVKTLLDSRSHDLPQAAMAVSR
jgi:hypothetical protein